MNVVLWILQVLLAALYLWHGWLFLSPPAELVDIMNAEFAPWFRISLGVAEILAAVGLILPGITRILPWLTAVTAACLMVLMACATVLHLSRGETSSAIMAAVIFALVTFVAYMRWKVKPFAARGLPDHNASLSVEGEI
ncbi:MAG: DoxX family protein [Caldilineaceae bacterium]|nr:DoxX family protein [Caldilineaceae bacterium]